MNLHLLPVHENKMVRIPVFIFLALVGYTHADTATIGIFHYNDLFGQLQRFKYGIQPPVACAKSEQKCSGGIAELMAHIREIRRNDFEPISNSSILTFAAGNMISGENGWIRLLNDNWGNNGWAKYGELLGTEYYGYSNYAKPDAMALGPREFDGGVAMVNDYIKSMKDLKAIVSNVNCTVSPLPTGEEKRFCDESIQNYQIIETEKIKIGIVGFVDTFVVHQSEPGSLAFQDTIISLKNAINSLLADDSSVKTIFAIGTGSLNMAKSIIDEIPQIKVVIYGGGKNSDISDSEYPLKYNSGYIATAYKYGESLGKLMLQIDDTNGNVVSVNGSARIKNDYTNHVEIDAYMENKVKAFADFVESSSGGKGNEVLGKTKINLEGSVSACWGKECPMGDLITDSMIHCALNKQDIDVPVEVISLWHSSGISGVLSHDNEITRLDVHKWMAYNNMATMVTMKGSILKQMFNASAQTLAQPSTAPKWGQFLQVSSGVEVHYEYDGVNNRVESTIKIAELNNEGKFVFQDVQNDKLYPVIFPSFLYNGRNVYHFLPNNFESVAYSNIDKIDIDMDYKCVENYIKALGVVSLGYQERMYFTEKIYVTSTSTSTTASPMPTTDGPSITDSPSTTDGPSITDEGGFSTSRPSSTTAESFWESMDSFSKVEVVLTSVGITLLVVIIIIAAIFAVLIKIDRRPTIIRHKRMYDEHSFT